MITSRYRCASLVSTLATLMALAGHAQAQGLDLLKGLSGSGSPAAFGTTASGTLGNAAGVIEYCLKNNYLSGDAASSIKDQLKRKLPGGDAASDAAYVDGSKGILTASDGKKMDLSGDALKKTVTKKACDLVLNQGKSMI